MANGQCLRGRPREQNKPIAYNPCARRLIFNFDHRTWRKPGVGLNFLQNAAMTAQAAIRRFFSQGFFGNLEAPIYEKPRQRECKVS
jgi:hypothetical protein